MVMRRVYELACDPFVQSDYRITDDAGHEIEHLLVDGCVFSYRVDHAARLVIVTEIEDADSG